MLQIFRGEMSAQEKRCMLQEPLIKSMNVVRGISDGLSDIHMIVEQYLGGQHGSMRQCMAYLARGY